MTDQIDAFLSAWTDAERTGDEASLDRLLTDDFVGVGPLGFTLPKPAWLARHQPGELTYETFQLDEVQARIHGGAAVITARQNAKARTTANPRRKRSEPPSHWSARLVIGGWPAST